MGFEIMVNTTMCIVLKQYFRSVHTLHYVNDKTAEEYDKMRKPGQHFFKSHLIRFYNKIFYVQIS